MSIWCESETLTLEKFQAMVENLPPLAQWIGYTVNSEMYHRLLSDKRFNANELEFGRSWTRGILFEVPNQTGEIVGWSNREDLNLYLEMMGARETEKIARRETIHALALHSTLPLSEVVTQLMHHPLDVLQNAARLIAPVAREPELSRDLSKFLAAIEVKPVENVRVSNQPFYSKVVKKKRR